MKPAAPSYFCEDYWAARALFLSTAKQVDATTTFIAHLQHTHAAPLGIDLAIVGETSCSNHIILCSATHGVEGYAGSAVQSSLLDQFTSAQLPDDDICVTFIHGLNPWGFANDRRVTENNVDLNRNFIDHSQSPPPNNGYEQLDAAINPPDLSDDTLQAATALMRRFVKAHGADELQAAISQGQYHKPDGCYFGGTGIEWSNQKLRHLIADIGRVAKTVLFIDVHTGLGAYGAGELIVESPPAHKIYETARDIWGNDITSTRDGSSSSSALAGTIDFAVIEEAPHANVIPITLEYGTVSSQQVFEAMRADNWLYHHGDLEDIEAPAIKQAIRAAFYPEQDDWKQMVIARGQQVFDQGLAYLSSSD